MPVASTNPLPKGRGRGRGRWAGDPFPSYPSSSSSSAGTRTVSVTPPSTPPALGKADGGKTPPESPSPRDTRAVASSSSSSSSPSSSRSPPPRKDRCTGSGEHQTQSALSSGPQDSKRPPATSPASACVPNPHIQNSARIPGQPAGRTSSTSPSSPPPPSPPNAWIQRSQSSWVQSCQSSWIQKSQSSSQLSRNAVSSAAGELPAPQDSSMPRSRSQNSLPADVSGLRVTAPSDSNGQRRSVSRNARAQERRGEMLNAAKGSAQATRQTQEKSRSRNTDYAEEIFARDRAKHLRLKKENGEQIISSASSSSVAAASKEEEKTSPRTSQVKQNGQSPPPGSNTNNTTTMSCVEQRGRVSVSPPSGEVPLLVPAQPPSTNVWVQRAQAREAQCSSPRRSASPTPPPSPRGGGGVKSPGGVGGTDSPRAQSSSPPAPPVSPPGVEVGGGGGEGGYVPNLPSPRGKDCSANSDSSADDAELEGLVGLPDHVLMYNKRDPVSVLMEYGQTREVKVKFTDMSRSGPHHASRFHTAAIVNGETHLLATGTSKKNAKKAAAILALRTMYERGMASLQHANATVNRELKEKELKGPPSPGEDDEHDRDPADPQPPPPPQSSRGSWPCLGTRVMHASRRLLDMAEETQFMNYSKDKVLAALVLERKGTSTVVGLGTGNRCIQYQNLPTDGSRVIHSHAEIIARRAFIRYMLRELASYRGTEREKHPLFTRSRHTGLLKLHDDIRVHLYISRPPCGDAAAFPTITNFPNRMRAIRKQGQLRTIIDDGEGAIPTEFPLPANANGKERLRVMTCSDKILRWNALGIQGALLSNFMDPVYLNSVVIGSHTGDQRGHVPRAISGRLKCGRLHEVLMKPFRICSPDIVYPPDSDNYAITKSKQYCITWSLGDPDAEVLDAVSGSVAMEPTEDSPSSRVSKRSLLALFRHASLNLKADHLACLSYAEVKTAARAYQRTKRAVEAHLQSCGFGQWLSLQASYGVDSFEEAEKM